MRIAILGGGTAGLCTAYYLIKNGYSNIDIYEEQSEIGGRLKNDPDGFEHCERVNGSFYFNFNSIYKDTRVKASELKKSKMSTGISNLSFKLIYFILLMLLPWKDFYTSLNQAFSSDEVEHLQRFIELVLYANNFRILTKLQGSLILFLYIVFNYVFLITIDYSSDESFKPLTSFIKSKCSIKTGVKSLLQEPALHQIPNRYIVNGEVYDYIFIATNLVSLQGLFNLSNITSKVDITYINSYLQPKNFNASAGYHFKLGREASLPSLNQSWKDPNLNYTITYKPLINYIFLSVRSSVKIEDPVATLQQYLPIDATSIKAMTYKPNTSILQRVHIGPRLNINKILKHPLINCRIVGTYTDQYFFETGEAAAVSAKLAVYDLKYGYSWWYRLMKKFWVLRGVYYILTIFNLI